MFDYYAVDAVTIVGLFVFLLDSCIKINIITQDKIINI
jgi:hypothetical protein